ncbi:hypothetical protein HPB50_010342 [Hyalomma asiaticum]|uniref:Uncharacterized protein n=1 Tax=Hyalomma asiaticum TaxID=266040 RepID=A0ACB7T4J1_HYAAI|nr:hypothetical protein HPB50_010342 [Hyalomma asiaticum]
MSPLSVVTVVVLVQLESWSGHVELLQSNATVTSSDPLKLVLWRLRSFSKSCADRRRVAVANRSLPITRDNGPVIFKRLPQGLYCFSARTERGPTAHSSVAVLTGQGPRDRCCERAPGQGLLWNVSPDGTLSASVSVDSGEAPCQQFVARLHEGACQHVGAKLVVQYQVHRNVTFHVHGLKPELRYCLTVAAGCFNCPVTCSALESKTVGAGVERAGEDALVRRQDAVVAVADPVSLDPVLAVLGVGSVLFLLAWSFHLYQRLPVGTRAKRRAHVSPV